MWECRVCGVSCLALWIAQTLVCAVLWSTGILERAELWGIIAKTCVTAGGVLQVM
jgi:hypothetical protein